VAHSQLQGKGQEMNKIILQNTKCVKQSCLGEIDFVREIPVGDCIGYACETCGQLYTEHGTKMSARFVNGAVIFKEGE